MQIGISCGIGIGVHVVDQHAAKVGIGGLWVGISWA